MPRISAVLICCALTLPAMAAEPGALTFEADIRPLLKAHCWHCHGEEERPEGGLDLRLVRFLQKGGESGTSIVAGKHADSVLYQRVASGEMPPGEKKMSAAEVERLARWIDQGAVASRLEPDSLAPGDIFTEDDRAHWSFQPVRRAATPTVSHVEQVRTPIDAFLLQPLESKSLSFSAEADRAVLIRRLSFDLLGLPPSPEAVAEFVADPALDAYERLVDQLLDSPAYGERWGRHWLDVAGYADSDGYSEQDLERKWAWKYRDYVVRTFNQDKPWHEFVVEQLAGDELVPQPYANLTAEQADKLIATGLLRMGPDGTGDGSVDQNVARNEVVAETIKIVSTSLLGLTVGCAQCHAHRYDPITHADYHRIRALFEPAYDWKTWRAPNARLVSQWSDETRQKVAASDQELAEVSRQRTEELDKLVAETFERELVKLPAETQPKARLARETAEKDRTDEHKALIKEYPFLNVDRGSVYLYQPDGLTGFNKKWDDATEVVKAKRPPDDFIQCLTEVPGHLPVTKRFSRGDFNQPREDVLPGELAVLNAGNVTLPADDANLPTSGRRLAYARHLTSGEHPLLARVLVNRIWLHHFGRGLVSTPGDFGALGERPSHPELLDWLAAEFVQTGWQLKKFQRLIVTSQAYRQSSLRRPELDQVDPENRLLGRMNIRRLEAETMRDTLLQLAGRLSDKMTGPPVSVAPDDVGQVVVAIDTRDSAGRPSGKVVALGENEFRRSLYVQTRRSMPLGVLEPFDAPVMTPNCEQRTSSTVAPQSLLMMNSEFVVQQSAAMAQRLQSEAGDDPIALVRRAWLLTFGRSATDAELAGGADYLAAQIQHFTTHPVPAKPNTPAVSPTVAALSTLCQALVSSNGAMYVE